MGLLPLTACGGEAAPDATCCTTVVNKLSALFNACKLPVVDPGDAIVNLIGSYRYNFLFPQLFLSQLVLTFSKAKFAAAQIAKGLKVNSHMTITCHYFFYNCIVTFITACSHL